MSSLVAPRPPGLRMREDDDRQGSLFGGDAFGRPARPAPEPAPPAPPAPPAGPPEAATAPPLAPRDEVAAPTEAATAPPVPPHDEVAAPPHDAIAPPVPPSDEVAAPPEAAAAPPVSPRELVVPDEDSEEIRVTRTRGRALAGPTLDDAVSRAWEGLVAEVPAACPVCHGEIEPVLGSGVQGYCRNCHVTLD